MSNLAEQGSGAVFNCGGCEQPIRANDGHVYDDCVARRTACAKACAGIANVAALGDLIEACDGFVEDDGYPHPHEGSEEACYTDHVPSRVAIRAALAKLRGTGGGA